MQDSEISGVARALRHRLGWTQRRLAAAAGVGQAAVSRVECGAIDGLTLRTLRRVVEPLGVRLALDARWRGGELARLLDADHAALQNAVKAKLERWGWSVAVEVTFNSYGDRGSYDLLAWHPATRTLLVIEVKTVIADVQGLLRPIDVKLRLARGVARGFEWDVSRVVACLVVADGTSARRRVEEHAALFSRFSLRGAAARSWLRTPSAPGARGLLVFVTPPGNRVAGTRHAGRQRVRSRAAHSSVGAAQRAARSGSGPGYHSPRE